MANVFKDILAQVKSRVAGSSATIRLLVAALLACIAVVLLYWILEKVLYLYLARSYVEELAQVLDLNKNLANAIVWIVFAITVFFASFLFSFSKRKRMIVACTRFG
jgi:hypothetical protein